MEVSLLDRESNTEPQYAELSDGSSPKKAHRSPLEFAKTRTGVLVLGFGTLAVLVGVVVLAVMLSGGSSGGNNGGSSSTSQGANQAMMTKLDTNNDGAVDGAEFAAAGGSNADFQKYDVDNNGVLDAQEVGEFGSAFPRTTNELFDQSLANAVGPPVKAWSISGGGLLAMNSAIGYAGAMHDAGLLSELDTVASNSGGSWFLTQYAFSDKFHVAVNTNTTSTVLEWLRQYNQWIDSGDGGATVEAKKISDLVNLFIAFAESHETEHSHDYSYTHELMTYVNATARADMNWETLVTRMLSLYNDQGPFTALPAESSNRVFTGPDLLFCTTLATNGQMDTRVDASLEGVSANGITTLQTGSAGDLERPPSNCSSCSPNSYTTPAAQETFPIAWKVSLAEDEWHMPQISEFTVTQPSTIEGVIKGQLDTAPFQLHNPTVGKIASMSSAAVGVAGCPDMLQSFADGISTNTMENSVDGMVDYVLRHALSVAHEFPNLAVCTGSETSCQFPSARTVDGGYSDNNAINNMVSHLQKKHGVNKLLRIAFLDNNSNGSAVHSNLQGNFGIGEWTPNPSGYSPAGYVEVFHSEQFSSHKVTDMKTNVTYAVINATTIRNTYYGIEAGTPVQLFAVNADATYGGIIKAVFGFGADLTTGWDHDDEDYARTASQLHESLTRSRALETFYERGTVPDGLF